MSVHHRKARTGLPHRRKVEVRRLLKSTATLTGDNSDRVVESQCEDMKYYRNCMGLIYSSLKECRFCARSVHGGGITIVE